MPAGPAGRPLVDATAGHGGASHPAAPRGTAGHEAAGHPVTSPTRLAGTLAGLGAAALFSLNGTLSAMAYERGSDPLALSFWRASMGGLLIITIIGLLWWRGRSPFEGRRPDRRTWRWLGVGILAVTVQNLAIFGAFRETSVVVALVVFYCYPVLIGIVSVVLGLERMDARRGAALVATFLGCVMVVAGAGDGGEVALAGAALAVVAAIAQTVYALGARYGFGRMPTLESTSMLQLGPASLILALALVTGAGDLDPASIGAPLATIYVVGAIFGQAVPMLLYLTGVRSIGPINTAAIVLLEPFFGALIALLVVGQPFGPLQIAGGILVAGSALLVQRPPNRAMAA